tara:strand:- start:1877 stop:2113 length:237 start_codon:yes stop_codon:yes gene_type:complete
LKAAIGPDAANWCSICTTELATVVSEKPTLNTNINEVAYVSPIWVIERTRCRNFAFAAMTMTMAVMMILKARLSCLEK